MLTGNQSKELLLKIADLFIEKRDELARLDAVIGDGDHGISMARGARAAKERISALEEGTCRDYFKCYGRALVSTIGGAMGPLFGSIFLEISKVAKDNELDTLELMAKGLRNAELKIMDLGGAKLGDKTMLESLDPAVKALEKAFEDKESLTSAFQKACEAAKNGVEATKDLISKRGRSKFLQEKSRGHQDAGATSVYYLICEMACYFETL
ncbi:dihydroxyacetone kinase subunit DhaL [Abyssisolibacter fermentans]|uniref:dihydroxyacetone kinase subunit DhaL n=1 Tax=Abyssisolibacter fermentans TaxID=1766203 RepID=UPI000834BC44|nr:dihydroxyacetone kinase subunit DhaL [Abyssisolibacter fermentans]